MRTSNPGLYSSFGGYAMEAEQLGIVSLGTGGTLGSEWIELKTNNVRTAPLVRISRNARRTISDVERRRSILRFRRRSYSLPPSSPSSTSSARTSLPSFLARCARKSVSSSSKATRGYTRSRDSRDSRPTRLGRGIWGSWSWEDRRRGRSGSL